jgi:hypothetical protein
VLVVALVALAGCGGGGQPRAAAPTETPTATPTPTPRPVRDVRRAHCPPDVAGCKRTRGSVIYVESVDPDGDGDLHVVLEDPGSLTLPGITVVDVAIDLRPKRDPAVGDRVSAAGPLEKGSYGQSQIHALVFNVRR